MSDAIDQGGGGMSETIKRYICEAHWGEAAMEECSYGSWVRADDHDAAIAAAQREVQQLTRKLEDANNRTRRLWDDVLRCIPADWQPHLARDWGAHLGNILAEYVGDVQQEAEKAKAVLQWMDENKGRIVVDVTERDEDGEATMVQWRVWHRGLWRQTKSLTSPHGFDTLAEAVAYAKSEPPAHRGAP